MNPAVAFYCISSELYFPGAVGLINSLRLVGHREPIFLLDCGLTPEHRERLAVEATIVDGRPDVPPYLLKTVVPLMHPAETMVLIDVDMVATRSLTPLIERAAGGRVVAFKDNIDRFVSDWGELLELGPATPRPYVSSGLVLLSGDTGTEVLRNWDRGQHLVDYEDSYFARRRLEYPFLFLDQDVLNGVLCSTPEGEHLDLVEARLAPHQPYRGLRITDEARLRCAYRDGAEPYVVHQYLEKPWVAPMYHGIYSRLLARLWLGSDVAVPLAEDEVPLRMRPGLRARIERKRVDVQDLVRWYARDVIPEWIRAQRKSTRSGLGGDK